MYEIKEGIDLIIKKKCVLICDTMCYLNACCKQRNQI